MVRKIKKTNCIFLDIDGTLLKSLKKNISSIFKLIHTYNKEELEVFSDLNYLNYYVNDYIFIIISNQPDLVTGEQSYEFHNFINNQIKKQIPIKEFFFCKCIKDDVNCKCYKPKSLMLKKAMLKYNISLKDSFFIGDTWRDIQMANNCNIKSILIDRGYYHLMKNDFSEKKITSDFLIKNFAQLKRIIKS